MSSRCRTASSRCYSRSHHEHPGFGLPVSRGVAIGRAVLVASSRVDVAHYFIDAARVDAEIERLRAARDAVAGELSALQRDLPDDAPPELRRCSMCT